MFDGLLRFFDRPNGGVEMEIACAVCEAWCAVVFAVSSVAVVRSRALAEFAWFVPHYYMAIPFGLAAGLTFGGLWMYRRGDPRCAVLRGCGAFVSGIIWFSMLFMEHAEGDFAQAILGVYLVFTVWQPRIMFAAWRRFEYRQAHDR